MHRNQFRVSVVDYPRDFRLMFGLSKEDIGRRQRNNFHVDAHAIHVFEPSRHVGHRRRNAKETRAAIDDYRLAGWTLGKGKLRRQLANLVEIDGWVVMRVKVEFAAGGCWRFLRTRHGG